MTAFMLSVLMNVLITSAVLVSLTGLTKNLIKWLNQIIALLFTAMRVVYAVYFFKTFFKALRKMSKQKAANKPSSKK